jgi:superfamily II DNA helicase RecQ
MLWLRLAGRDGLPSRCLMLWAPKDFQLLDLLADMDGSDPSPHQEQHRAGMLAYVNSSSCRHALLVNHFSPGAADLQGPCTGGCDACDRRRGGQEQHRDVSQEAALLLAAVRGLKGLFGLGRPVSLLRGSNAKDIQPWMRELQSPLGGVLHGAGTKRSEGWWKGLAGLLQAQDLIKSVFKRGAGNQMGYSVLTISPTGIDFLNAFTRRRAHQQQQQPPVPAPGAAAAAGCLQLVLPADMEAEDAAARRQAAAAAAREAERMAAAQQLGEEAEEKEELRQALRVARKQVADALGQVSTWWGSEGLTWACAATAGVWG